MAPVRLRGITARWRRRRVRGDRAARSRPGVVLADGAGMAARGLPTGGPAQLARIMHVRAVLAVRRRCKPARTGSAPPWWHSERRIRRKAPFAGGTCRTPKLWAQTVDGGHAGLVWAIETELTPKTAARTAVIMAGLLCRRTG